MRLTYPALADCGDTVEDARKSLREGIGYMLEDYLEQGRTIPDATSTSVDFSEFDPNPSESHYEIEWLTVELPEPASHPDKLAHQAA